MGFLVHLLFILFLYCIKAETVCDKFNNQNGIEIERRGVQFCLEDNWCVTGLNFTILNQSDFLVIEKADYIPTCFIYQLPNLRTIYGVNLNISYIELMPFANLPRLEKLDLSFNFITTVKYGMFNGVPLYNLNLSWNEINFIGEASFYQMESLRRLDISRNYLASFDGRHFFAWDIGALSNTISDKFLLEELILSHNNIQTVQNFGHFANLKILDLSYNKIFQISENALGIQANINVLDLTDNWLSSVSFKKTNIGELRLALNNLKHKNSIIDLVRSITIFGNPLRCSDYDIVLDLFKQRGIKLVDKNVDVYFLTSLEKDNYPHCLAPVDYFTHDYFVALNKYEDIKRNYKYKKYPSCNCNSDCPDNKLCKAGQCWDSCMENVCHQSEKCIVVRHKFSCTCPEGYVRNPYFESPPCVLH